MSELYDPTSNLGKFTSLCEHLQKNYNYLNYYSNDSNDLLIHSIVHQGDILNIRVSDRDYIINLRKIEKQFMKPKYSIKEGDILSFIKDKNRLYVIYPKPYENEVWKCIYSKEHHQFYWWNIQTGKTSWNNPKYNLSESVLI